MAEIRVMLKFDYPPPTGPESRHLWMLLNPDHLRTITDLSDLIRGRYYPNQRGALSLYVHDCLLPPGESARLVRDNDVIRVQWQGYNPEDDDMDGPAHPAKKRSRQRCEEDDAGDRPTIIAKKQKCESQMAETPRGRKEMAVLEECEQEESPKSSRRKAKKKKKVLEESAQEAFPEESSERSKHKKHSKDSASLKSMSLRGPIQEPSAKRGRGSSSSHQEPSEIPLKPGKKSNKEPLGRSAEHTSGRSAEHASGRSAEHASGRSAEHASGRSAEHASGRSTEHASGRSAEHTSSSDSTDQKSSTKPKKPSKRLHKSRTVNKTKPNHELPAEGATKSSFSDSSGSSSDQESSKKPKEPPKVLRKDEAAVSVHKTNSNTDPSAMRTRSNIDPSAMRTRSNIDPSAMRTRSNIDYMASSYDQEFSREVPPEATRNPSVPFSVRTVFSSEMGESKNHSASDNGDIRQRRLVDVGTVPPLNGTSQEPHEDTPSYGSDSDTNIIQGPIAAQSSSSVVPSCVTNGGEAGGIHQGAEPNPSLYDHGKGRGRGVFPWRGQGVRGFRGWGDRGKGRGFGHQFFHNYDSPSLKKQQMEEEATNTSVIIQNPPESPKKDYSDFPLLAAPPQVGRVIAFKILELNENFSPELSDYKEGVVRCVDPVTLQVEVELLSRQKRREPGKFDLVYELADGKEIVEFAVRPDRKIKEPWSSLVAPRLVMEKGSKEGTSPQHF